MKLAKIILVILVVLLSGSGLVTGTAGQMMPYVLLLAGAMLIIMGIQEFQKRNSAALPLGAAAVFVLFVGVYIL